MPGNYLSEDELARQAIGGARPAFEELVRRTAHATYANLVLGVRDRQLAEDLCQETYLRAWAKRATLADAGRFRPWLAAIARGVLLDHLKARDAKKRDGRPSPFVDLGIDGPGADARLVAEEETAEAIEALEGLPEPYRTALTLRYLADSPRDDVSRHMGVSGGALRGLLSRGLTLLRERLGVTDTATARGGSHD